MYGFFSTVVLVIYQTALINPQRYEKDSLTFVYGFFVHIIICTVPKGTIGKLPQASGMAQTNPR
jgi:hypothetical protein